jgi:HEAT repeat protein
LLTNRGNARIAAVYTLGQMGPAAVDTIPWLTELLNRSKSFDKLLLADTIARIEPTRRSVSEILIGGLYSRNTDVRYLSTVALGAAPFSQQAAAEQALREVAADRNSRVRSAASEALGHWQARQEMARAASNSSAGTVVPAAATSGPRR